jgi:hypothetical protein
MMMHIFQNVLVSMVFRFNSCSRFDFPSTEYGVERNWKWYAQSILADQIPGMGCILYLEN